MNRKKVLPTLIGMGLMLVAGWLTFGQQSIPNGSILDDIRQTMLTQQEAWNRGDFGEFFAVYAEDAIFVSGTELIRGRDSILQRFRHRYQETGPSGLLKFSDLRLVDRCGCKEKVSCRVWIHGKWHLTFNDGTSKEGQFTLGWRWKNNGWMIFYDHSS